MREADVDSTTSKKRCAFSGGWIVVVLFFIGISIGFAEIPKFCALVKEEKMRLCGVNTF